MSKTRALIEMGIFDFLVFNPSLRLSGKFCPHPKFAQREDEGGQDSACLPDRSIYFFRLRAEADETEQKLPLKTKK